MTMLEPCTNWYGTRQHLSINLAPYVSGGRSGLSMCSGATSTRVWDDDGIRAALRACGSDKRPKPVAEIQPCKLCARAAAKLAEVTP
jgi:hypothetical protein